VARDVQADLGVEVAGLRRIRFHDLRHSCATLLYEQGVEINKIQDILGHKFPHDHQADLRGGHPCGPAGHGEQARCLFDA
jgi:integrase